MIALESSSLDGREPGQHREGAAQAQQPQDLDVLLGRHVGGEVAREQVDGDGEVRPDDGDAHQGDADERRDDEADDHAADGHDAPRRRRRAP